MNAGLFFPSPSTSVADKVGIGPAPVPFVPETKKKLPPHRCGGGRKLYVSPCGEYAWFIYGGKVRAIRTSLIRNGRPDFRRSTLAYWGGDIQGLMDRVKSGAISPLN